MDYLKIYNSLIERARNRKLECYTESHHVIPRCMNGSDDSNNLVELTPEEHYVAHQLLVKIHPNHAGLIFAAAAMCMRPGNKLYGWLRREYSRSMSTNGPDQKGERNSQYGKRWITDGRNNTRIARTDQIPIGWRAGRITPERIGRAFTEEHRKNIGLARKAVAARKRKTLSSR